MLIPALYGSGTDCGYYDVFIEHLLHANVCADAWHYSAHLILKPILLATAILILTVQMKQLQTSLFSSNPNSTSASQRLVMCRDLGRYCTCNNLTGFRVDSAKWEAVAGGWRVKGREDPEHFSPLSTSNSIFSSCCVSSSCLTAPPSWVLAPAACQSFQQVAQAPTPPLMPTPIFSLPLQAWQPLPSLVNHGAA